MTASLPFLYAARHGETAWSRSGQHTGLTDVPLTAVGEATARGLAARLAGQSFSDVFTSPLIRAVKTCELAGFGAVAQVDRDLIEWDYGDYEGLRRDEILLRQPDWQLFRDGCPGGESAADVAERADRVVRRVRALRGSSLVFSSGHFLRALAARWLGSDLTFGRLVFLGTSSLSILGYEHALDEPVIRMWNEPPATLAPNG